jgi:hypothetical protein
VNAESHALAQVSREIANYTRTIERGDFAFQTDVTRSMQAFVPAMQGCLSSPERQAAMNAFRAEQAARPESDPCLTSPFHAAALTAIPPPAPNW